MPRGNTTLRSICVPALAVDDWTGFRDAVEYAAKIDGFAGEFSAKTEECRIRVVEILNQYPAGVGVLVVESILAELGKSYRIRKSGGK